MTRQRATEKTAVNVGTVKFVGAVAVHGDTSCVYTGTHSLVYIHVIHHSSLVQVLFIFNEKVKELMVYWYYLVLFDFFY